MLAMTKMAEMANLHSWVKSEPLVVVQCGKLRKISSSPFVYD